ncbi:MAG: amidase [Actinomycetota bacterium]|nr:amidase [Actinomycetota bacterium]
MTVPVTERSALSLAFAIRSGELTARSVVDAHIAVLKRAAPRINALVADRFDAACAEADDADARVTASNAAETLPPLLGVPFTVKESIAVAGMPQSAGLVARAGVRASQSASTVSRLRAAGAIPLGVTNTSELTLWIESVNRLYGRTSNPYAPGRAAGGSSGGEGAAVGSGGSPFGLASDIGGSIRVPALFCGVFGHKPSSGLVPTSGNFPPCEAGNSRLLGVGPIARRAEDLIAVLRIIAGPDGFDTTTQPAEIGDPAAVSLEGLRVVIAEGTSWRPISRELHDARERAAGALAAAGARIRRVRMPSWRFALLPFLARLQAGSTSTTADLVAASQGRQPRRTRLLAPGGPHTMATRLTLLGEALPDTGSKALLARAHELAAELRTVIGDGVLLHPAHRGPAPRNGTTVGRPWLLTPAAIFNLAEVPVTEVPIGRSARGLPLGVQVAGPIGHDHVTIAVAMALERAFGGWSPPALRGDRHAHS